MNASFTPFPVLETQRLTLRAVSMNDLEEVFFLRSDNEVLQYISKPPASLAEAQEFIERITLQWQNNESINWAMVPKGQTRMIGSICLWNLDAASGKAEVGYSMHPDHYGKGYMQEAMEAILAYGFEVMHLELAEAITHRDNTRSRRLLERNGFARDAQFEQERVGTEEPEYATIYCLRR